MPTKISEFHCKLNTSSIECKKLLKLDFFQHAYLGYSKRIPRTKPNSSVATKKKIT